MVDPTPNDRFNALGYSTIRDDISLFETEINLPVGGANAFNKAFQPGASVYATLTDVLGSIEVIKITGIEGDKLTVERGQDVTIAQAWLAGSVITQRFVATNALQIGQKSIFRTIAFNPNGGMTADYPGEEVREIGLDACANRWWKNTEGTKWRLIAGIRCPGEIDDPEGYPQPFLERDLFIVGGTGTGSVRLQDTDGYQVDIDTWFNMSDLPVPARGSLNSFSLNLDFMYVVGGVSQFPTTYQILCDEFNLDVWAGKTAMPLPARRDAATFQLSDKGYIAGGDLNGVAGTIQVDEYDVTGDSWAGKTALPHTNGNNVGLAINSKGYSIGGLDFGSYHNFNDEYVVDSWAVKQGSTLARIFGMGVEANGKGYCYAGSRSGNSWTREMEEYDPSGDSWASKTDNQPPDRNQNAGAGYDDKCYSFGGRASSPTYINDVDEYDPVGDSWTSKTAHPLPDRFNDTASGADGGL